MHKSNWGRFSCVIPAHNEEQVLAATVGSLLTRLSSLRSPTQGRIFIVDNGSTDRTGMIARNLAASAPEDAVRCFSEMQRGLGFAYQRGMIEALRAAAEAQDSGHWILLTAADLPFGFTDLDQFFFQLDRPDSWRMRLAIGSKAHTASVVPRSPARRLMTWCYRQLRATLLRMQAGDSQGSLFVRADLARALLPLMTSGDYFYSTELVFHAERMGACAVELPVVLSERQRPSRVRPVRDSLSLLRSCVRLRLGSGTWVVPRLGWDRSRSTR